MTRVVNLRPSDVVVFSLDIRNAANSDMWCTKLGDLTCIKDEPGRTRVGLNHLLPKVRESAIDQPRS